ncbi:MAG: hypothetical protein Q4G19_01360 [Clostridia bacterium]|nr:hypothetical protein [Clostridia bacterium]
MKEKKPPAGWKKRLRHALWILFSLVMLAVLYIVLILIAPQDKDAGSDPAPQPALAAAEAKQLPTEGDLALAMVDFPVPVMSFLSGSGWSMTGGICESFPVNGGFGRVIRTYWQDKDGTGITLESIYPADAFDCLGMKDLHFASQSGPSLFQLPSVRMENENEIRLHVQTDTGLYAITAKKESKQELGNAIRSIQLFTAEKKEN